MTTLLLVIISTCIFLPYIIYSAKTRNNYLKSKNTIQLHVAEDGPTKRLFKEKTNFMSLVDVDIDSIPINPELQYFVIKNQCMESKGISEGDIVGVRLFKDEDKELSLCKEGELLLIFLDDEHFKGYKIRELGHIAECNTAYHTYHYKDGIKHCSSKPHSIKSIKGVVEEIHQAYYRPFLKTENSKN